MKKQQNGLQGMLLRKNPVEFQKTLERSILISGFSLHLNIHSHMLIQPAEEDSGIVFVRDGVDIPALVDYAVSDTKRCTILKKENKRVVGVEHVLSGLWGMGIDNASIILSSDEPPMMGNNTYFLVLMILEAGIERTGAAVTYYEPAVSLIYSELEEEPAVLRQISVKPCKRLESRSNYEYCGSFPDVPKNLLSYRYWEDGNPMKYLKEISSARTFAKWEDVMALKKMGMSLGATFANTLIYDNGGNWISDIKPEKGGYEPVKHKVLDLIGDMALVGRRIKGDVVGYKTGHKHNVVMARMVRKAIQAEEKKLDVTE